MEPLKYLLPLLALPFFSSLSCGNPSEPKPTETVYVNDTFLSYWFFPVDSWWVYKRTDTVAEMYDTVKVYSVTKVMEFEPRLHPFEFEAIRMNLQHSSDYLNQSNEPYFRQHIYNNPYYPNSISSKDHFNFSSFFSWPIDSQRYREMMFNQGSLVDTNSIQVPAGFMSNVVHVEFSKNHIWLAKDVGFIKYKHANDGSVWELIDYEIK